MCYILGYYNINLLNHQFHHPTVDFINTVLTNVFYSLFDKPTRITSSSAELIDNIVTNFHSHVLSPAILLTAISDHLSVLVTIQSKTKIKQIQTHKNFFYKILINESTVSKFRTDMIEYDWSNVYLNQNTKNSYTAFIEKIKKLYDKNLHIVKVNYKQNPNNHPWITKSTNKNQ